jgi:flagellar basal body-associated protein FliL
VNIVIRLRVARIGFRFPAGTEDIIIIIIIIITVIELSLCGSSPYTSRDKTNKTKYTQQKQYKKTLNKLYKTQ